MTFDFGQAPEPTSQQVAAAFGDDTAASFEQIRGMQTSSTQIVVGDLKSSGIVTSFNPDLLAIIRFYLEKYDALAEEDRKLYRGLIAMMANPPMMVMKS
jgi:hypothetical protein